MISIKQIAIYAIVAGLTWQLGGSAAYVAYSCTKLNPDTCAIAWSQMTDKIPAASIAMGLGILLPRDPGAN